MITGLEEIATRMGKHRTTVTKMIERGEFPRPDVHDGRRDKRWSATVVDSWFKEKRKQARNRDERHFNNTARAAGRRVGSGRR